MYECIYLEKATYKLENFSLQKYRCHEQLFIRTSLSFLCHKQALAFVKCLFDLKYGTRNCSTITSC